VLVVVSPAGARARARPTFQPLTSPNPGAAGVWRLHARARAGCGEHTSARIVEGTMMSPSKGALEASYETAGKVQRDRARFAPSETETECEKRHESKKGAGRLIPISSSSSFSE
jgi:hypothetical protein